MVGPIFFGCLFSSIAFIFADIWLPMGYPILVTILAFAAIVGVRSVRHRALFRSLYRTAGRYLPPARLVTLARSGFADPVDGHEREVSILLVDLAGFTSFSNRPDLSASDIVQIANRYFTLMQGTIDRYGGCSDKFLGDAVLAFWNGLSDEPEHALKALAAGSEIIRAVGHAKESENNLLAARAVVCSGKVYVGDLGAKQRSNFTIIGPAVNETFRLEKVPDMYGLSLLVAGSAAKLIETSKSSAQSMGLLENSALVRIDDVELKGFEGPRPIYALVPRNDPGLANFQAGRNALDQKMFCEARTHLKAVDSGMLQAAAKTLLQRIDETTLLGSRIRSRDVAIGNTPPESGMMHYHVSLICWWRTLITRSDVARCFPVAAARAPAAAASCETDRLLRLVTQVSCPVGLNKAKGAMAPERPG